MRNGKHDGKISVHAISGNHVVTLGLDATDAAMKGLLGFALQRTSHADDEAYWMRGYKPFKEIFPQPKPGVFYSSFEHPIQSFIWGDYTVEPGKKYTYKVVPIYGKPKNLVHGDAVEVDITAEPLEDPGHEIYFNRGVAASQAYALKFGEKKPDKLSADRRPEAYAWLSRGLFEAIIKFIEKGKDNSFKIRAALYELDYPPVMEALKKAQLRGVDVKIIYHAKEDSQAHDNETVLFNAGFALNDQQITFARSKSGGIFHNKFFLLIENDNPTQVFTGSTNISEGGIFGHSNVGHCIKDGAIAEKYRRYWEALKTDPKQDALDDIVEGIQGNIEADNFPPGASVIFSPRKAETMLDVYVKAFANAKQLANITLPFNIDNRFMAELERKTEAVRYVILNKDKEPDKKKKGTDIILKEGMDYVQHFRSDGDVYIAPGGFIEKEWEQWMKETLTGFNGSTVLYIHTKFLLIDALSNDPIVITGSANFSAPSTDSNDENMLLIRGNKRVADIYLGEFFRIYDHLYFRYIVTKFANDDEEGGFLAGTSEEWLKLYKNPKSSKFKKRKIFSFGFA
jgi:phosphatidylserine/phosphatidylglycerophosphate/cardiolipin synthase-like enzyme